MRDFIFLNFYFSLPAFNIHRGKDAFSCISETRFLKAVEFTALCVSVISSFFLPQARQAKYYMIQDPSLQTHVLPLPALTQEETMKNTGVSFSIVQNAR